MPLEWNLVTASKLDGPVTWHIVICLPFDLDEDVEGNPDTLFDSEILTTRQIKQKAILAKDIKRIILVHKQDDMTSYLVDWVASNRSPSSFLENDVPIQRLKQTLSPCGKMSRTYLTAGRDMG